MKSYPDYYRGKVFGCIDRNINAHEGHEEDCLRVLKANNIENLFSLLEGNDSQGKMFASNYSKDIIREQLRYLLKLIDVNFKGDKSTVDLKVVKFDLKDSSKNSFNMFFVYAETMVGKDLALVADAALVSGGAVDNEASVDDNSFINNKVVGKLNEINATGVSTRVNTMKKFGRPDMVIYDRIGKLIEDSTKTPMCQESMIDKRTHNSSDGSTEYSFDRPDTYSMVTMISGPSAPKF